MERSDINIDGGKPFDWGRTSLDYARYRDIYPQEFYDRITGRNLCAAGQRVLVIAAPDRAEEILTALRRTPGGEGAARIGRVSASRPGQVVLHNAFGGSRLLTKLTGAQLPRIC